MRTTAVTCGIAEPGSPFGRYEETFTRYAPVSKGTFGVDGIASTDCPGSGWWRMMFVKYWVVESSGVQPGPTTHGREYNNTSPGDGDSKRSAPTFCVASSTANTSCADCAAPGIGNRMFAVGAETGIVHDTMPFDARQPSNNVPSASTRGIDMQLV